MNITLGQNLTHLSYTATYREPSVGVLSVGVSSFLSILETQLGLLQPSTAAFARLQSWLVHVDANKSGSFFEKSYEIDPIGTAKDLLRLRDELICAGWNGEATDEFQKIKDLAKVNSQFRCKTGVPERIIAITETLSRVTRPVVDKLTYLNEPIFLQKVWVDLFAALKANGAEVSVFKPEFVSSNSKDLQSIKDSFDSINEMEPVGDGSVRLVQSGSAREGADLLARYLASKDSEELKSTVVIAGRKYRPLLLNAFNKFSIPFAGDSSSYSLARPSLQIVVIALGLAWYPKDPKIALALLQLPFSPFSKMVRSRLTRALEKIPAVGSRAWKESIDGIVSYLNKQEEDQSKIDSHLLRIEQWFNPSSSKSYSDIDKAELVAICDVVREWAQKESSRQPALRQTVNICLELSEFLQAWPAQMIDRELLRKLTRETFNRGTSYLEASAQAGGPIIVESPSEVMAAANEIIWWDATASSVELAPQLPLTLKERSLLQRAGVELINPKKSAELLAERWNSPIGFAKDKIMFFAFDKEINGEPDYLHPIFSLITNPNDLESWLAAITVRVGELDTMATLRFMEQIGAEYSNDKPVYKSQIIKDWNISGPTISLRDEESPSSIELLLGCPLSYTLRYCSDLKAGSIPSIDDQHKLIGALNHRVMELTFKPGVPPSPDDAGQKVLGILRELIPEFLPELELPKNTLRLKEIESNLERAAQTYAQFLVDNDLQVAATEARYEQELYQGTRVSGKVDQVLEHHGHVVSVVDFKSKLWSLFSDKLKKGNAIQPAIYSWLCKENLWPDMAYFGIDRSSLIVAGQYNKGAETIKGAVAPEIVIQNLIENVQNSQSRLQAGSLEARGLLDREEQEPIEAPCRFCDFDGICGKRWCA